MQTAGTSISPAQITLTPLPSLTAAAPATQLPTVMPTLSPTVICDRILPGNPIDITIPDDSLITAGTLFTKTWRLLNGGNCTWTRNYSIVWVAGEVMTEQKSYRLTQDVPPGSSIDISLDMTAPANSGTYQSYWMLQNADGFSFGIGPTGKSPFWVKIDVQPAPTATPAVTATSSSELHLVIYSGIATIQAGQSVDITSGIVTDGNNLDLSYASDVLTPTNGASLTAVMSNQPNYDECLTHDFTADAIPLAEDTLYKYFCVQDNQNNVSSLQILAFEKKGNLTVELITWGVQ